MRLRARLVRLLHSPRLVVERLPLVPADGLRPAEDGQLVVDGAVDAHHALHAVADPVDVGAVRGQPLLRRVVPAAAQPLVDAEVVDRLVHVIDALLHLVDARRLVADLLAQLVGHYHGSGAHVLPLSVLQGQRTW